MSTILDYLQYDFVKYAFVAGVLIAMCSALLGTVIVTKKLSFIGDGLSHVAFGATTVASVLGIAGASIWMVLPVTMLFSLLLFKDSESRKTPRDAALAVISVGGLAFGYLFLNLFSKGSNLAGDVCGFLFGSTSILTLGPHQVVLCVILLVVVVAFFVLFYNKIYAVTFDESFSKVAGVKVAIYKAMIAMLIDTVVVLAMNLVGSLLISALVILPTLSAMRIFCSFKQVVLFSVVFSVLGALAGLSVSIVMGTPVGCTIVAADSLVFVACYLLSVLRKRG